MDRVVIVAGSISTMLIIAWATTLHYLEAFVPDDVRAWRRLAALRGHSRSASMVEKLALRIPFIHRLQKSLDLERLLAIANRPDTPLGFLIKTAGIGIFTTAASLVLDITYARFTSSGNYFLGLPLGACFVVGLAAMMVTIGKLRQTVRHKQVDADRALGDMMMLVAIMTDGRGLQLEDAVKILSRCVTVPALQSIVDNKGYTRLITEPHHNTSELYKMIGEAYGIPTFQLVADAAANTNVGFGERDMYTRVAKAVYQDRLAEAKMKAARARIAVTIPVVGMLIPLLVLLGAPALTSLGNGLK